MKNDSLKSIIVLGSICLVVAVLLSSVNYVTAPIIEQSANSAVTDSLKSVLPDATGFEEVALPEDSPATVTGVFKDNGGSGYAITLSTSSSYSQSPLTFTLGVGSDGKISAVEVTNYAETKNFGDYPQSFIGADSALSGVDLYAGVTYSSQAFKSAVADAMNLLVSIGGVSAGEKSEEQIISEIMPVALPGAYDSNGKMKATETNVNVEGVITAYKADNGVGYLLVAEYNGEKLVGAVSASGGVRFYDLEANIVETVDSAFVESITAKLDFSAIAENDKKYAENMINEGELLEKVDLENHFGVVTSVYRITSATESSLNRYVFVAKPFGYKDPMTLIFEVNNGVVSEMRNAGELIQLSEYYNVSFDEKAYKENIAGKSEEQLTDDVLLVSGATVTGNSVKRALADVFEIYKEVAAK